MQHNHETPPLPENKKSYVAPFIRTLMPDATEDQILEASENLRGYLLAMQELRRRIRRKQETPLPARYFLEKYEPTKAQKLSWRSR
jgi:hypothetical protein